MLSHVSESSHSQKVCLKVGVIVNAGVVFVRPFESCILISHRYQRTDEADYQHAIVTDSRLFLCSRIALSLDRVLSLNVNELFVDPLKFFSL